MRIWGVGCVWGSGWGVDVGLAGGAEGGVRLGGGWCAGVGVDGGASGCGWGAPVSIWGADGSEVLCFRRRD